LAQVRKAVLLEAPVLPVAADVEVAARVAADGVVAAQVAAAHSPVVRA
jgi:hypothetical protein